MSLPIPRPHRPAALLAAACTAVGLVALAPPASAVDLGGTLPAAKVNGEETEYVDAHRGTPYSIEFTNSFSEEGFPWGWWWIVHDVDADANSFTTDDRSRTVTEVVLTGWSPIVLRDVVLGFPEGAAHTFRLYGAPDNTPVDGLTDAEIDAILAVREPLDSVSMRLWEPEPPVNAQFYFHGPGAPTPYNAVSHGTPPASVFASDWDGDGRTTVGEQAGSGYRFLGRTRFGPPELYTYYGRPYEDYYLGDWDGNGTETLGVRRGNTFYLTNSTSGGAADVVTAYGRPGDVVYIGDWDGDGDDTPSVRRGNEFHLKNSFTGGPADRVTAYGRETDEVFVGDWDGDGVDTPAVRRGNEFHLIDTFDGGPATSVFTFGRWSDKVLVGDWTGAGRDEVGVYRVTDLQRQ